MVTGLKIYKYKYLYHLYTEDCPVDAGCVSVISMSPPFGVIVNPKAA